MPVRLSELRANVRTVAIPVDGDVLNVTYRPSGITPEVEDRLDEATSKQRIGESLMTLLAAALVSWDLLGDDGKPLPVTVETMRVLPLSFLAKLVQAVTADMRPNAPSGGSSAVTS